MKLEERLAGLVQVWRNTYPRRYLRKQYDAGYYAAMRDAADQVEGMLPPPPTVDEFLKNPDAHITKTIGRYGM